MDTAPRRCCCPQKRAKVGQCSPYIEGNGLINEHEACINEGNGLIKEHEACINEGNGLIKEHEVRINEGNGLIKEHEVRINEGDGRIKEHEVCINEGDGRIKVRKNRLFNTLRAMNHMNEYPRGSEWRKWDLHFHTPASYDYKDKRITCDDIIAKLVENDIAVVAITDHHFMDVEKIKELQEKGKDKNITVLPGIECKAEMRGTDPIHFIGLFSETEDIEYIWGEFKSKANISEQLKNGKTNEQVYCKLEETCKIIKDLGGITSIHAGSKTSSIENITNALPHNMAQKRDIIEYIDIFELGKEDDQKGYEEIVFPTIGKVIPMIICSDNHDCKNYITKQNLWIKADPTFKGLQQIIYEPIERVKIQEDNPLQDYDKPYFSEISIQEEIVVFKDQDVKFKKNNILINPNLVTIIGGRGEGKSVLIDYFSNGFSNYNISSKHFPNGDYKLSEKFNVKYSKSTIQEDQIEFQFSKYNSINFLYISQNQVKEATSDHKKLGNEIKDMLKLSSFEFVNETQNYIDKIISKIREIKKWLEETLIEGASNNNEEELLKIIDHDEELMRSITNKENKEKLEKYTENIKSIVRVQKQFLKLDSIKNEIKSFENKINDEIKELDTNITPINFKKQYEEIGDLIEQLKSHSAKYAGENEKIKNQFSDKFKGDLSSLLSNAEHYNKNIERVRNHLIEIKAKKNQLARYKQEKKSISEMIRKDSEEKKIKITEAWQNLIETNDDWNPDQKSLMEKILSDRDIEINGKIYFDSNIFYSGLRECINGTSWRYKNKDGVVERHFKINDYKSFCNFLKNKIDNEFEDHIENYYFPDIENYFYDLSKRKEYLYVQPEITYKGKTLDKISVGQRGTVYLCLKLATNAFSTPIIYDQPEDDLDNQFIYEALVDIFQQIKKFRQVIIVTHNANLVVNADSEQVIVATNTEEILSYKSGSLENKSINENVCKILEGGEVAFEKRKNKYQYNSKIKS